MITPPAALLGRLQAEVHSRLGDLAVAEMAEAYVWALDVAYAAPEPLPDPARAAIATAELLLTARRHAFQGEHELAGYLTDLATLMARAWRDELTASAVTVPDFIADDPGW